MKTTWNITTPGRRTGKDLLHRIGLPYHRWRNTAGGTYHFWVVGGRMAGGRLV